MGLEIVVKCGCGYREEIKDPEGGMSRVGTAVNKSVRHDGTCQKTSQIKFPGGVSLSGESRRGGFRSGRRY